MNPPSATSMDQKNDTKVSPFDLIKEHEEAEEKRLQSALELLRKEEVDQEKSIMEAEALSEERSREEITKELLAQKEVIGTEMKKAESDMDTELATIESLYEKRAPDVIAHEVSTVLSLAS